MRRITTLHITQPITNDEWGYNYNIYIIYNPARLTDRNLTEFVLEVSQNFYLIDLYMYIHHQTIIWIAMKWNKVV